MHGEQIRRDQWNSHEARHGISRHATWGSVALQQIVEWVHGGLVAWNHGGQDGRPNNSGRGWARRWGGGVANLVRAEVPVAHHAVREYPGRRSRIARLVEARHGFRSVRNALARARL